MNNNKKNLRHTITVLTYIHIESEKVNVKSLSGVKLFAIPWTVAYQASLSMGFSRQEYRSGLPFPSPGDLPDPGIEPRSPTLQTDAFILWATREAHIHIEIHLNSEQSSKQQLNDIGIISTSTPYITKILVKGMKEDLFPTRNYCLSNRKQCYQFTFVKQLFSKHLSE